MRAAVYHRVSTTDQHTGNAREELRAAARALGAEVVLDIEETGSGARNDRPGLLRLMSAAHHGKLDVVLVWKLDRFGRSALDLLANVRALEAAGVRFKAITQGIHIEPGGDPMSRLMLTMLAAIAEFERDLIRDRTRAGLQAARARGSKIGRPRTRPEHAAVAQLRADGLSWAEVARTLKCTSSAARRAMEDTTT